MSKILTVILVVLLTVILAASIFIMIAALLPESYTFEPRAVVNLL